MQKHNLETIRHELFGLPGLMANLDVEYQEAVDSTNSILLERQAPRPTLLLTDFQRAGRGRLGRAWQAAPCSGVLMSLALPLEHIPHRWIVSLLMGVSLATAFEKMGLAQCALKWPNDVVVNDAKLSGILVEVKQNILVIGCGINIEPVIGSHVTEAVTEEQQRCMGDEDHRLRGLKPLGLRELACDLHRDRVVIAVIQQVAEDLTLLQQFGAPNILTRWRRYDAMAGRRVSFQRGEDVIVGVAQGLCDDGAYGVLVDGAEQKLMSGEMRLRAMEDASKGA